jgi:hypothetical protein
MKSWLYRNHKILRRSAGKAGNYQMVFVAERKGREVARGYFKRDVEDAIDRLCDGLTGGTTRETRTEKSTSTASAMEIGTSQRSDQKPAGATNFGS